MKCTIFGRPQNRFYEETLSRKIENDMLFAMICCILAGIQLGLISAIFLGIWLPLLIFQLIIILSSSMAVLIYSEPKSILLLNTPGIFLIALYGERNWSLKYIFAKEIFVLLDDKIIEDADLTFKCYGTNANVVFNKGKYAQLILKHV